MYFDWPEASSHTFTLQRGTEWAADEDSPERLFDITFVTNSRGEDKVTVADLSDPLETRVTDYTVGDPGLWAEFDRLGELMREVCGNA